MKNNVLFRGIMPALVTPLDDFGKIKRDALKKLVDWHISCGVSGFYICGSTGEGLLLTPAQRMEMLEATLDAVGGRVPVIDHIGDVSQSSTIALAKHAEKAGAAAISSIPPIYFAYSDDDIFNFYKAISESSSLPLLMYGYPGIKTLPRELIKKLMTLKTVIGLKWTYQDYYGMQRVKSYDGGNINVINGPDESLIAGLAVGADAGIGTTYNIMPGLFVKLYNAFRAGKVEEAGAYQNGINNVIEQLLSHNVIATTKAVLRHIGYDVGECVAPLHRLTTEENDALISAVTKFVDFEKQEIIC